MFTFFSVLLSIVFMLSTHIHTQKKDHKRPAQIVFISSSTFLPLLLNIIIILIFLLLIILIIILVFIFIIILSLSLSLFFSLLFNSLYKVNLYTVLSSSFTVHRPPTKSLYIFILISSTLSLASSSSSSSPLPPSISS